MPSAYYGRDLAFIHDSGFGGFARGAAPGLIASLRRAARAYGAFRLPPGHVLLEGRRR